jgi:pyruvate/2-oxoglutarate dehydrogenase complex dihydrolipoamide dehydrogenase (E3) component
VDVMRAAWDLAVLGGGTAGIVAAQTAASLGARVVLVERERPGGDCLWTGCVPSKALLAAARSAHAARSADALGVDVSEPQVRWEGVMAHVQRSIAAIEPHDSASTLRRQGVAVREAHGSVTPDGDVSVDGVPLGARAVLLATGSQPTLPDLPGMAHADPLTSDSVWNLESRPGRLTVLGGGPSGCELAQAFARLGTEVTLVEQADRLLPCEPAAAGAAVAEALGADGVRVRTGAAVTAVQPGSVTAAGTAIPHDRLLVLVGRTPRTAGLGLVEAGVRLDGTGAVVVDAQLRTHHPRMWAAGDVTGPPWLTHLAGVNAGVATSNALLGTRRRADPLVPRVTFTDPEVATVGVSPDRADTDGYRALSFSHPHLDRAIADRRTDGHTTLLVDRRNRLVGASVVGPRAGEALAELTLAIREGLRVRDLVATTHPYPTYGDAGWNAAIQDFRRSLAAPGTRTVTRALLLLRRLRRRST